MTEKSLVLAADQDEFTPVQVKTLEHLGITGAGEGDLQVFHHVCQRTGLDPFARQIYMIAREVTTGRDDATGEWIKERRWTIQTGIDGFRLIGRRAADHAHHTVSVQAPEWAKGDEGWRPWWNREWGLPVAARVTIHRAGQPFTAIALFDEYKQTKSGGRLTAMWDQRPAGQLAKCAEALAWRMAFPQDLSGIYTDEEMDQADNPDRHHDDTAAPAPSSRVTADVIRGRTPAAAAFEEEVGEAMVTDQQSAEIGALLLQLGYTDRKSALGYLNDCLPEGKTVRARKDLTEAEADGVLLALRDDAAKASDPGGAPGLLVQSGSEPNTPGSEPAPAGAWDDVEVRQPPDADQ